MSAEKYLKYIIPFNVFGTERTKEILTVNPTDTVTRKDAEDVRITVYDYNNKQLSQTDAGSVEECFVLKDNNNISWINVDGLRKSDVEVLGSHFNIHPLIIEDIWSFDQRAKMDEVEGVLFCLLNMLYYNEKENAVEQEQISIVLGKDFVLSFQEDPRRDVFDPIREKLKIQHSKLRQKSADYLCYSMLDLIVDNYFLVMERLGERMESIEEDIIRKSDKRSLAKINALRKELIILKRNIAPVRDLIASIIRSESELLQESTFKYFNDIHDHIKQAYDLSENYRDVMLSMQDLYIGNVNLRLNEVMKVVAIVTCVLAPATVIGGIFGMNFDVIPTAHKQWGFYTAVGLMFIIPVGMLYIFKKRGWF
jgi:magnesium transporter